MSLIFLLSMYYLLTNSQNIDLNPTGVLHVEDKSSSPGVLTSESCPSAASYQADIETVDVFSSLDLEPPWMERREYWGSEMEDRYQRRKPLWSKLPLRVIVMPHSHNDPGWLQTMEGYFATSTKQIITNMVNKLTEHSNMTFIWTEMTFLSMWWETAEPHLRTKLRSLLDEGRLEIPTGGWVMTDEANVELYSMLDQLVEGHSFLRSNLNVRPLSSWSVDPFGHGAALPHLLAKSGINNMVIMRIHYAWKEWLARYQLGDFLWKQSWESDGSEAPLCHNFPYDIYSIKHSCGPHPQTCLGFDFRHVDGEYNEFTAHYTPIDSANLATRSELLLDQYGRTGSLVPHNVVLVPLGDDFRYNHPEEFTQQYENYMKIMEYINNNPDYHAKVTFGTLSDYFTEVRSRMSDFSTLTGDFFVYSDIFSEGRPAYWSGYFATRPFLKLLSRQLASKLRTTEILFTLSVGLARQVTKSRDPLILLESHYEQLEEARRALALFQHHDAITGTSKSFVMQDYQSKLLQAVTIAEMMTEMSVQYLLLEDRSELDMDRVLRHLVWRGEGGEGLTLQVTLDMVTTREHKLVVVNSLGQEREDVVTVRTNSPNVCVKDDTGAALEVQVAPSYNATRETASMDLGVFDVWFLASMSPLSLTTYTLTSCEKSDTITKVFCLRCPNANHSSYSLHSIPEGAVQLENQVYRIVFDPVTKLMTNVTNKLSGVSVPLEMEFVSYPSAPFRSGAYLLSIDDRSEIRNIFTDRDLVDLVILSGPLFAELHLVWKIAGETSDSTFSTKVRLYHAPGAIGEGIGVENMFDLGPSPNMRDRELVMRLKSGLASEQQFYTDQSGLGMTRREWVEKAGLEGNYYPVTSATYLQDSSHRLSLLVDHATAGASVAPGWLEVMVDRRTMYDDNRGMGEGVLDSRPTTHTYWLLIEPRDPDHPSPSLASLSPLAVVLARYLDNTPSVLHTPHQTPPTVKLLQSPLPSDHHLINLRSWSPKQSPGSPIALMIIQRQAPDCSWASLSSSDRPTPAPNINFHNLTTQFQSTSLTGNFIADRQSNHLFVLKPMEIAAYNVTFH